MNWKMAQNNWRFGEGEIIDRGSHYVFRWFGSKEEFTIDWSSFDAIMAQNFLKTAKIN